MPFILLAVLYAVVVLCWCLFRLSVVCHQLRAIKGSGLFSLEPSGFLATGF